MNVNELNALLAEGDISRKEMWPRLTEMENKAVRFEFEFALKELPTEPGLIIIRGPRQYGKSTWLDMKLRETIIQFGKGSGFYLNGDDLDSSDDLEARILDLESAFLKKSQVKRLFIDEISVVSGWERIIKRLWDRGHLRDLLIITTGSKATDLRRGAERLPGRKGRLEQTNFVFLPISYRQFYEKCHTAFLDKTWLAYLISGGSPVLCNDLFQMDRLSEPSIQLIRDWILGGIASSGRSRIFFQNVLQSIFRFAGTPVGYAKLARESGLSNNTVAAGYIEDLSDLLTILPAWQWDHSREILLANKPCKFHFINLAAAVAFHRSNIRYVHELEALSNQEKGIWLEWLVAQEIWRRTALRQSEEDAERIGFWKSKEHEIDFVAGDKHYVEVKWGKAGPLDFTWFPKTFPKSKLLVVCQNSFETNQILGMTPHEFLMSDF